jgi:hypothetical protein
MDIILTPKYYYQLDQIFRIDSEIVLERLL